MLGWSADHKDVGYASSSRPRFGSFFSPPCSSFAVRAVLAYPTVDAHSEALSRMRRDILECYRAAMAAVDGRRCVSAHLADRPAPTGLHVVAIGKAASAMARGAMDAWGPAIERGLVISKTGHIETALLRDRRFVCIESSHPIPDRRSLQAGRALVAFLDQAPANAGFLFLISGGASSLVEVPAPGVELSTLVRINEWLLGSGLDIARMNAVRQGVSAIKAGRLVARLGGRDALGLLISDVLGDDPRVIGSGLLVSSETGPVRTQELPDWLATVLRQAEAALPDAKSSAHVKVKVIATLDQALAAAAARGTALGYPVRHSSDFQHDEACAVGTRLAQRLRRATAGLYLWGGETIVRLPDRPGRGGRCQALALCAALELRGQNACALLAAGTDGTDGPGEDAGALVDGATVARGRSEGLDPRACLAAADAGRFLEAAGDLIQTGPTGTNVMDIMIGGRLG